MLKGFVCLFVCFSCASGTFMSLHSVAELSNYCLHRFCVLFTRTKIIQHVNRVLNPYFVLCDPLQDRTGWIKSLAGREAAHL